jgi:DNA ligase-associated metallophosphoesterase
MPWTEPPRALDHEECRHDSVRMIELTLNGARLFAEVAGALYWPEQRTVVVSDLHFEKGSAFAARGVPLPPYDTAATLDRLEAVLERHQPERVICLGDSFHDQGAAERASRDILDRVRSLADGYEWIWITGNHDPSPDPLWGGRAVEDMVVGPLIFRHVAARVPTGGEVSGHFHPKARVRLRGRSLSGQCFVTNGNRLVMPSFGAFTGGLDVSAPEIRDLFQGRFEILFLGPERLYRFPRSVLLPSRALAI